MTIFFDTETTGIARFKDAASHPGQPYIVQIAALLYNEEGTEVASLNTLVKPKGWIIDAAVAKIHGITTSIAERDGIEIDSALQQFASLCELAKTVVAHNIVFDELLIAAEVYRRKCPNPLDNLARYCTMQNTTKLCKIPARWGGYKWPKLVEAYQHFFSESFEGAHDALADVRACARIYYHLNPPCSTSTYPPPSPTSQNPQPTPAAHS